MGGDEEEEDLMGYGGWRVNDNCAICAWQVSVIIIIYVYVYVVMLILRRAIASA